MPSDLQTLIDALKELGGIHHLPPEHVLNNASTHIHCFRRIVGSENLIICISIQADQIVQDSQIDKICEGLGIDPASFHINARS